MPETNIPTTNAKSYEHSECHTDRISNERNSPSPVKEANKVQTVDYLKKRAIEIADLYQGECLSTEKLSIVKGQQAFKFKCQNGHIFYKFISEVSDMVLSMLKKTSISTATSGSPSESSDEEMSHIENSNSCQPNCRP